MKKLTETEWGHTITPPIVTAEIVPVVTYTTEGKTFKVNDQADFDFMQSNSRLENDFRDFHNGNPHVYKELVELACQLKAKGRDRYSLYALFEVVRWHRALETSDEDFKLNNNHRPYYARMIMDTVPELNGFFNLRVLKCERKR